MEVILKQTVDTLGEEGDVVKVKPGYARNYLFPRKIAVLVNKSNLAILKQEQSTILARKEKQRKEAEMLIQKIAGATIVFEQRVGEGDKLFGSVTSADIATKLADLGIEIDRKKIVLDDPIKTLGEFIVTIKVGYQAATEIKVQVVALLAE